MMFGGSSGVAFAQAGSDAGNNAIGQPGDYGASAAEVNASRLRMQHPPGSASVSESRSYVRAGYNTTSVRSGATRRVNAVGY